MIPLLGGQASADEPGNGAANAGWRFNSDGKVDRLSGTGWVLGIQNWYTPPTDAVGGQYFIRATLVSGDTPSGSLNTWFSLSSFKTWTLGVSGGGSASCVLLIEISTGGTDATVVTEGQYGIDVLSEP